MFISFQALHTEILQEIWKSLEANWSQVFSRDLDPRAQSSLEWGVDQDLCSWPSMG